MKAHYVSDTVYLGVSEWDNAPTLKDLRISIADSEEELLW